MFTKPSKCPNDLCIQNKTPVGRFYIKKGYYKTKYNHQKVPRYLCKTCGRFFSSNQMKETRWQKKPFLNQEIFKLYCSAMTLRRIAKVLGVSRQTVANKFQFMAMLARKEHQRQIAIGKLDTSYVEIDELHTYEHTKYLPLAVTLVVRAKTGQIIAAEASRFRSTLGPKTPQKYQGINRPDGRKNAADKCLDAVARAVKNPSNLTILSDKTKSFFSSVKSKLPQATYQQAKGVPPQYLPKNLRKTWWNPLFSINHLCAKIRADLSRVRRRTWITTKKMSRLQDHLDIYIAWNNGYSLR